MGPIRLEHKGSVTVRGCQSGYTAKFKLHSTGMLSSKSKMHVASPSRVSTLQMALCLAHCNAGLRQTQDPACSSCLRHEMH